MRVLIFGGAGMLGHRLLRHLGDRHETRVTLRAKLADYARHRLFTAANAYDGVDVRDFAHVTGIVSDFRPDVVVNGAGIVKQRPESHDAIDSIEINALFPHLLARLARERGMRMLHLGTDCVFSGEKGNYTEKDRPDPQDLYDQTKLLGEVGGEEAFTLRTSMIGLELERKTSLVEWFLAQKGKTIKGYRKAVFSGFTTAELSRIIENLAVVHGRASGVYHVSSDPISKFDLLAGLSRRLELGIEIVPDDTVRCDRSLDSGRFRSEFGYAPPSWDAMLDELADEIMKARHPC